MEGLEDWLGICEVDTKERTPLVDGTACAMAWSCGRALSIWRMTGDSLC